MPTPRFRDLRPSAAASVVDSFLGRTSNVELTEKLAGQHLTATSSDGRTWTYSVKSGAARPGGFFPGIERALSEFHPDTSRTVTYRFEVLKKKDRPDFIAYDLKRDAAVEYSGELSRSTASILNDSQDDVTFLTKDDIKKTVGGLESPALERLEAFVLAARQGSVTKREMIEIEELLMGLIDSGVVSSAAGGTRIEGLFGRAGKMSFKIPSAAYADLQRRQAKFYALVRAGKVREVVKRFEEAAGDPSSDKAVSGVLDYIDYVSSGGPPPGYKVFFASSEVDGLKTLSDAYKSGDATAGRHLAQKFFQRVADRGSWVQSGLAEGRRTASRIIETNGLHVTRSEYCENLLRCYVRLLHATRSIP